MNRRTFIKLASISSLAACPSILAKPASAAWIKPHQSAPIPPGAHSFEKFNKACTACQLCVSKCPSKVLRPALYENGFLGIMQPVLKYDVHHFCEYECTVCIDICPTRALGSLSLAQKKLIRIGRVQLIIDKCIVVKDNKACGACAEHCPTGSLRMVPYKPGITKPEIVDKDSCIGCGGCESICPVRKEALYIERLDVHETAAKPKIKKQKKVEINDFGF